MQKEDASLINARSYLKQAQGEIPDEKHQASQHA